jgi:hypothetical protein
MKCPSLHRPQCHTGDGPASCSAAIIDRLLDQPSQRNHQRSFREIHLVPIDRNVRAEEDIFDHHSNSSEKFLAKLLLLNGEFRERGIVRVRQMTITQETLAEMIGPLDCT